MAKFFDPTYNPLKDAGSSSVEVSDLRPEQSRDVDLRDLEAEERDQYSDRFKQFAYEKDQEDAQSRISSYMKAAKTAGAFTPQINDISMEKPNLTLLTDWDKTDKVKLKKTLKNNFKNSI